MKFINQVLSDSNKLLGTKYKPFHDFDLFNENDMPTNSDAAMMLNQYINCFEKLRSDNIVAQSIYWYWLIDEKKSEVRTVRPKKINEK